VQPLWERVHYGFEYIRLEDPIGCPRMSFILKDVSVVPLQFEERNADN
jgi:hypothetical protein